MPLVLAIEPDLRQAGIVKRVVREKVGADVTVVDSRDAALEAIRARMPDVLLLTALLSPRDEDELIAHLRTLEGAGHLQTHTIPQLASALGPADQNGGRGLFGRFRRKKDRDQIVAGCAPDVFAEEVRTYLQCAAETKQEREHVSHRRVIVSEPQPQARDAADAEPTPTPGSSWASPFEWPATNHSASAVTYAPVEPAEPLQPVEPLERLEPEPLEPEPLEPGPLEPLEPESVQPLEPFEPVEPVPTFAPADAPFAAAAARSAGQEAPDARFGMRDEGFGIREFIDPLCLWARAEREERRDDVVPADLPSIFASLAVPAAVASIGYPRGCRIRAVRVLAPVEAVLST